MLVGLSPMAGGTQESNYRGLGYLIGGLDKAERPRVAQGFLWRALEPGYQCGQKLCAQPPRLLPLAGAPALKLVAVRKVKALEEIALQRLRRLVQGVGRDGIDAV